MTNWSEESQSGHGMFLSPPLFYPVLLLTSASAAEKYLTSGDILSQKHLTVLQIYRKYSVIVYDLFRDTILLIFLLIAIFQTHIVRFIL